jgi:indolepyruvate ferredoxin oxidoreductase alpha subunit
MTGGQPHPGMSKTLMGEPTKAADIFGIVKALGVEFIEKVNAFDLASAKDAVQRAITADGVRVLIFEGECINIRKQGSPLSVSEKCTSCGLCVKRLGCPALSQREDGKAVIDANLCTGCGLCESLCAFGAIGDNHEQI